MWSVSTNYSPGSTDRLYLEATVDATTTPWRFAVVVSTSIDASRIQVGPYDLPSATRCGRLAHAFSLWRDVCALYGIRLRVFGPEPAPVVDPIGVGS